MTQFIWIGGSHDAGSLSAWLIVNLKGQEVPATVLPTAGDIIRMNNTGTMTGSMTAGQLFFNSVNTVSGTSNIASFPRPARN